MKKMTLKETFRYANFLDGLCNEARNYLGSERNVMTCKEEHFISKVDASQEDREEIKKKRIEFDIKSKGIVNGVMYFLMDIVEQRELLSKAISRAKQCAEIDYDASIALNKVKQNVAYTLSDMAKLKPSEDESYGTGYKFAEDGTQASFIYKIKNINTIDFDRDKAKALAKKLNKEADATSEQLDKMNILLEVDFTPKYELGESFEDCLKLFVA